MMAVQGAAKLQPGTGIVTGTLKTTDGKPAAGVRVGAVDIDDPSASSLLSVTETDSAGRKVTADTAMPPFPTRQWALVGVLLLVGLGLAVAGWSIAGRAAANVSARSSGTTPRQATSR